MQNKTKPRHNSLSRTHCFRRSFNVQKKTLGAVLRRPKGSQEATLRRPRGMSCCSMLGLPLGLPGFPAAVQLEGHTCSVPGCAKTINCCAPEPPSPSSFPPFPLAPLASLLALLFPSSPHDRRTGGPEAGRPARGASMPCRVASVRFRIYSAEAPLIDFPVKIRVESGR